MTLGRNWFSNRKNKDNRNIVWTTKLLHIRRNLLYENLLNDKHAHSWQISNYVPKWIIEQFVERDWEWKQDNGFVQGNIYGYLWSNGFKYNK